MNDTDMSVFGQLFKEAYATCFGHPLQTALTETESKLFSNQVLDQTGLIIGWKSLKNYSYFILEGASGKKENPSVATLDTLARYVLKAPYTDEIQRKNKESHYPWWFRYKEQVCQAAEKGESIVAPASSIAPNPASPTSQVRTNKRIHPGIIVLLPVIIVLLLLLNPFQRTTTNRWFTDHFNSIAEDSLTANGWQIQAKDTAFWNRRGEQPGHLTLFTLAGDSWPDSTNPPGIKNLLIRTLPGDCFTAEAHITGFIPGQNWQQAGMLLLEDTAFSAKSLRLSLAYNDYTGGAPPRPEILIQAITSLGIGFAKPEEIAHVRLFSLTSDTSRVVAGNMAHSALRIEKQGNHIRLLYANGPMANSAFKEVISRQFDIKPKFIGLFALKGFVQDAANMPVHFKFFTITPTACE
jgi:hypothetical protein